MNHDTTYVGIDAHKKEHRVAMLLPGSDEFHESATGTSAAKVRRMVRRIRKQAPGGVVFCYEAGVCGFALKRQIESAAEGVRCVVVAPSLIPIRPGARVHTDRRDARSLASYLRAGLLTEVQPPTEQQESARDLCRCRDAARKDLMRIRHQVIKFLLRRGVQYGAGSHWTMKHMRWLREVRFERPLDEAVYRDYLGELDHRLGRLEKLDEQLAGLAESPEYRQRVGWLRCFRGVDTVTAMIVLTELYGFERFGSARGLMSFVGLTASEQTSADSRRMGGITKAGNGRVRRVLIEASWHQRRPVGRNRTIGARRQGQPDWVVRLAEQAERRLHRRYWRLVGKGKMPVKAVTAVAREFSGFLWSVLYHEGPAPKADDRSAGEARPKTAGRRSKVSASKAVVSTGAVSSEAQPPASDSPRQAAEKFLASPRKGRDGSRSSPGRGPGGPGSSRSVVQVVDRGSPPE